MTTTTTTPATDDAIAYAAFLEHGSGAAAARALGIPARTAQVRIARERARLEQDTAAEQATAETPADDTPTEVIRDRKMTATAGNMAGAFWSAMNGSLARPAAEITVREVPVDEPAAQPTAAEIEAAPLADEGDVNAPDGLGVQADEVPAEPVPARRQPRRPRGQAPESFPKGLVTPVQFFHHLVSEGLARPGETTQRIYSMVKSNGFPLVHVAPGGETHTEALAGTRPAVRLTVAVTWYAAKYPRQNG